jgi:hypothetical protein
MYPRDKYGSYKVADRWIRAWHGQFAGFTLDELREYEDGKTSVHKKGPVYINDNPELAFAHSVFMRAQSELESFFDKKKHE